MTKKLNKPYKRNITGFISSFGVAEFNKVEYVNEPHKKLSVDEKKLLGVFDVSHFNL
jgi:hypothetical protein